MKRIYWIVNARTKRYVEVNDSALDWEGEWKKRYPHVADEPWENVCSFSLVDFEIAEGIYHVHDLGRDGGYYTLLVDVDKHTPEQIKRAKDKIRRDCDVIHLSVLRLKEFK